jgi:nitrogen fixation protein NifZ
LQLLRLEGDVQPQFDYGDEVRVVRTIRNDGTFPGLETGTVLVRQGSVGHVRNVGTFLQDQIIYAVHFFDVDRTVGCREEELIPRAEAWVPTKFLFGDKVLARIPLAIRGQVVVPAETAGEIIKVFRHHPGGPGYHVLFDGRMFEIPETALLSIEVATEPRP